MHAATLTSYEQVRAVVVSYLQAKRVWIPTATYAAGSTARRNDPDAMDIGKVDDKKRKGKGKGDEKGKKGNGKEKGKGKDGKHGGKDDKDKKNEKEKCAICWRAHSTQDCWYNAKGQGKQKGKGQNSVQAVSDETVLTTTTSVGPSAAQAGSTAQPSRSAIRRVNETQHIMHIYKNTCLYKKGRLLVDPGACVSVCRPGEFSGPVDPERKLPLYAVDDTELNCPGVVEPVLLLGGSHRQTAQTTFQVVDGLTDDILSVNRAIDAGATVVFGPETSYVEWADGSLADFFGQGNQFVFRFKQVIFVKVSLARRDL